VLALTAASASVGLAGCESTRFDASGATDAEGPNVVVVLSDDHALRGLSCYGGRTLETPHLDRLAAEGVKFENCFVTNSLCSPSRASVSTGKYSHAHGVRGNVFWGRQRPFDSSQPTVPKRLKEAGYTTLHVGKWHLGRQPRGFDYWKRLPGQGRYNDPTFVEQPRRAGRQPTRTRADGYVTDVLTTETIDTIETHREDAPFFLQCWHKAPHRKWVPDERYEDLFADDTVPTPPTFDDDYDTRASAASRARMRVANMPDWRHQQPKGLSRAERKHWNYQRYIKNYLRTVKSLDENVGRLLAYLDETGLAENTLVVYASDNGFFLGEHGFYDKRFMYEESIRIPLLVRYPPLTDAGRSEDRIARNVDLAPTFMDLAGLDVPDDVHGRSLRPLLADETTSDWEQPLYYHYYEFPGDHAVHRHYGVRTDRYKLIYYYRIDEWELFDLRRDPHELRNVVDDDRYAAVFGRLRDRLRAERARYGDDTGAPVPAPEASPAATPLSGPSP
jgi:arylsulfatase A-like enzyme